jgi:hypothetical protein
LFYAVSYSFTVTDIFFYVTCNSFTVIDFFFYVTCNSFTVIDIFFYVIADLLTVILALIYRRSESCVENAEIPVKAGWRRFMTNREYRLLSV